MPHRFETIPDELDPPETALESPPRCPDALQARAHNPKVAGSNPAPAMVPLATTSSRLVASPKALEQALAFVDSLRVSRLDLSERDLPVARRGSRSSIRQGECAAGVTEPMRVLPHILLVERLGPVARLAFKAGYGGAALRLDGSTPSSLRWIREVRRSRCACSACAGCGHRRGGW